MARSNDETEVLERGDIYFVYRPKVDEDSPEGIGDVQRLYTVLSPREGRVRMISVGRKRMPEIEGNGEGQNFVFVEALVKEAGELEKGLQGETYETKTRGERTQPAARPAGEGAYALVRHGDHTHLAYALELPRDPDEPQQEMNIAGEASYVISVKNPEKPSPSGAGLGGGRAADYPKRLQERFGDRRFISLETTDLLDYEGAELLLIGASEEPPEELGIDLDAERESQSTAEIFDDLRMEKSRHPVEPLLKGEWE